MGSYGREWKDARRHGGGENGVGDGGLGYQKFKRVIIIVFIVFIIYPIIYNIFILQHPIENFHFVSISANTFVSSKTNQTILSIHYTRCIVYNNYCIMKEVSCIETLNAIS